MATMMPRPTTTSAAATTSTKKTASCPPRSSSMRENVTKVKLTALSMSSMHMYMTKMFRRTTSPAAPMPNSTAARTKYQSPGTLTLRPAFQKGWKPQLAPCLPPQQFGELVVLRERSQLALAEMGAGRRPSSPGAGGRTAPPAYERNGCHHRDHQQS